MIEPTSTDIGRSVIYRERGNGQKVEQGILTSFSTTIAFVLYDNVKGTTSAATRFEDLEWAHP